MTGICVSPPIRDAPEEALFALATASLPGPASSS